MKKKGVLIFCVISFLLLIKNVNAEVYKGLYVIPDFDFSGHSLNKQAGVFYPDIGLGDSNNYYALSSPSRKLNSDYFTLQVSLLSVSDPIIDSDNNRLFESDGISGRDGLILYGDGTSADIYFNSGGFNTHYAYQQDVQFSLTVVAIYEFNGQNIWNNCEIMSSWGSSVTMKCPNTNKESMFKGLQFRLQSVGGATGRYQAKLAVNDVIYLYDYSSNSDVSSAIKDQTDQQHKDSQAQLEESKKQTDAITSESGDVESSKCGLICKIGGVFKGIVELPGKLVSLLIDALKSLFVPTNDQLYEIINDSKELSENFGFVGESINFFINIFTSLLGMVNGNGCVELPEFSVGPTSLFEKVTFWNAQNVCLSDNIVLSTHIDTIRTVTSIVLVCLFISFAAAKFFNILSKNDSNQASMDAYSLRGDK